jgi:redox-sensing transcriptional repressor
VAEIPGPARERLLRLLGILEQNPGKRLSSAGLEALTGWGRGTVRKDISCLGGAAGSASGYSPEALVPAIRRALGLDRRRRFCVTGLGRLGSAFLRSEALSGEFELAAGFDTNVNRVEILSASVPLYPAYKMGEVIGHLGIEIALLCVPAEAAQAAAERLASSGVRGILNFAPAALSLPKEVTVRNVHLADELRGLAIQMRE